MRLALVLTAAAVLIGTAFAQPTPPKDAVAVTAGVWAKASGEKPKVQAKAEADVDRGYSACVREVQAGKVVFLCVGQYVQNPTDFFTPTLKKDGTADEWYDYGRYKCWQQDGRNVMQQVDKAGNPLVVQATAPQVQVVQTAAPAPTTVASYPVGFTSQPVFTGGFGQYQYGTGFVTGGCPGGTCPTNTRVR